jgi:hypothetical protein
VVKFLVGCVVGGVVVVGRVVVGVVVVGRVVVGVVVVGVVGVNVVRLLELPPQEPLFDWTELPPPSQFLQPQ